ncbi:hypothetical protein [Flagellimonas sp. S3867]|uniref:hypothetical protein n=1 Tax=Flagellimonas sp. S3867 TaxID=2768063 RepID=UPI001687B38C|nr:hypothetical protein [Flagellimonas sp. S3867]
MKMVLSYSLCFLYVLCVSLCGCPPDNYFVEYESVIPNVVAFEGEKINFLQGDTLYLIAKIPRNVVTVEGERIDLQNDLGTVSSHFAMKLSKKGDFSNPSILSLSENELVVINGEVYLDEYDRTRIHCAMLLDGENYVFRFGVLLKEKGDFILSQYHQSKNEWVFVFEDQKMRRNTYETVIVKSPLTTAGSTNLGLEFTVN